MGSAPCPASVGALTPVKQEKKQTRGEQISPHTSALVWPCMLQGHNWHRPWKPLVSPVHTLCWACKIAHVPHLLPAEGVVPYQVCGAWPLLCQVPFGQPWALPGLCCKHWTCSGSAEPGGVCRTFSTNRLIKAQETLTKTFENQMWLQWVFMLWDVKSLVSMFFNISSRQCGIINGL